MPLSRGGPSGRIVGERKRVSDGLGRERECRAGFAEVVRHREEPVYLTGVVDVAGGHANVRELRQVQVVFGGRRRLLQGPC